VRASVLACVISRCYDLQHSPQSRNSRIVTISDQRVLTILTGQSRTKLESWRPWCKCAAVI